jgi:hypothetical protein
MTYISTSISVSNSDNAVINGDMRIAQIGSFNSSTDYNGLNQTRYNNADLWPVWFNIAGDGPYPGIAIQDWRFVDNSQERTYWRHWTTTQNITPAADSCVALFHPIAATDNGRIDNSTFLKQADKLTLSFDVNSDWTGNHYVAFYVGQFSIPKPNNPALAIVLQYPVAVAGVWQRVTINIPTYPTFDQIFTSGSGHVASLFFPLIVGDNYKTTEIGKWHDPNFITPTQRLAGMDAPQFVNGKVFRLTNVMLNARGNNIFRAKSGEEALLDCLAFYFQTNNYGTKPANGNGFSGAFTYTAPASGIVTSGVMTTFRFPVSMFTEPVMTAYSPVNNNNKWYNIVTGLDSGNCTFEVDTSCFEQVRLINQQVAGDLAGHALYVHFTADARIY